MVCFLCLYLLELRIKRKNLSDKFFSNCTWQLSITKTVRIHIVEEPIVTCYVESWIKSQHFTMLLTRMYQQSVGHTPKSNTNYSTNSFLLKYFPKCGKESAQTDKSEWILHKNLLEEWNEQGPNFIQLNCFLIEPFKKIFWNFYCLNHIICTSPAVTHREFIWGEHQNHIHL